MDYGSALAGHRNCNRHHEKETANSPCTRSATLKET